MAESYCSNDDCWHDVEGESRLSVGCSRAPYRDHSVFNSCKLQRAQVGSLLLPASWFQLFSILPSFSQSLHLLLLLHLVRLECLYYTMRSLEPLLISIFFGHTIKDCTGRELSRLFLSLSAPLFGACVSRGSFDAKPLCLLILVERTRVLDSLLFSSWCNLAIKLPHFGYFLLLLPFSFIFDGLIQVTKMLSLLLALSSRHLWLLYSCVGSAWFSGVINVP